jgi:hypothetical protein
MKMNLIMNNDAIRADDKDEKKQLSELEMTIFFQCCGLLSYELRARLMMKRSSWEGNRLLVVQKFRAFSFSAERRREMTQPLHNDRR